MELSNNSVASWAARAIREERLARRIGAVTASQGDIPMSVKAVVLDGQGRVLILKDARSDWNDLPGGHVHDGENELEALNRELREETGLVIGDVHPVCTFQLVLGGKDTIVEFFRATALTTDVQLSGEHESAHWVEPGDLLTFNLGVMAAPVQTCVASSSVRASGKPKTERERYAAHNAAQHAAEAANKRAIAKALATAELHVETKQESKGELFSLIIYLLGVGAAVAYRSAYKRLAEAAKLEHVPTKAEEQAFAKERKEKLGDFATRVVDEVWIEGKRSDALDEDTTDRAQRLQEAVDSFKAEAQRAAETESQAAYGAAQVAILKRGGFKSAVWVTMDDEKVRESHRECEAQGPVPLGRKFVNGLRYPGDPSGPPSEVINCRCWLVGVER